MFKFGNSASRFETKLFASWTALLILLLISFSANAIPSMARQTGMQCAACHTVFPELTPFGRQFKLRGFSMSTPKQDDASFFDKIPISALLQISRTSTKNTDTPGATPDNFLRDRETIVQAAGLYYGGKITDKSGALVQYNYDGIERRWGMEMFDVRYANTATFGKELVYGFTLNNNPTLSDIYNSTPVWSFPHTGSAALMPAASTLVDMTLASQVGVGDVLLFFGTGFGATNPAVPAGSVYSSAAPTTRTVTIQIAGIDCPVAFAGLTGAGLYQMNVTIPATVPNGDQPIVASINGQRTQTGALITILKP